MDDKEVVRVIVFLLMRGSILDRWSKAILREAWHAGY